MTENLDFIREIVAADAKANRHGGRVATRFPPEPNGYLHIGHAKSICLNFGIAQEFSGVCHLRFDDTNPDTEDMEYVEAIQRDVRWLGFDWGKHLYYASDYYEIFYQCARKLILEGKAYVDSLNEAEIRQYRGSVNEPGRPSPYRQRTVAENLDLFERMAEGEFPDGAHVLRAKGDMAAKNMKMRDPLLYRIRHSSHYRTGDDWCIYPMYDYAHPLSDAVEGITHSVCTLEFENNRDIYNWVLENAWDPAYAMKTSFRSLPLPRQYEFARLNLEYTVMSKRKLLQLVEGNLVQGWDDPRLPTVAGMRRRGITPEAIRDFAQRVGVAKTNSRVEMTLFESCLRDDLNLRAPRVMAVLRPLKLIIDNYPAGQTEWLDASYWPHDVPKEGSRRVPFSNVLYIERDDFMENPPKKFYRLSPGREVRLRYGYIVKCLSVVKDAAGNVVEVHCTYDPATRSGSTPDGRKVEGTIHWLSAAHALPMEVRLYDRLLATPNPDSGTAAEASTEEESGDDSQDELGESAATSPNRDWTSLLNPNSLEALTGSYIEPSILDNASETRYQFERQGYFWQDPVDSTRQRLVFNRIVTLRDTWSKISGEGEGGQRATPGSQTPAATNVQINNELTPRQRLAGRSDELVAKFDDYVDSLGLGEDEAEVLTRDRATIQLFEQALTMQRNPKAIAGWIRNEILRELKGKALADLPFDGAAIGRLVQLVDSGEITNAIAKNVFAELLQHGGDPAQIVASKGLKPLADADALLPIVQKVIANNPEKAVQIRAGKSGLLGFFVGQVMKETGGKANAQLVQTLLQERLTNQ
jgi:glutaminyl-tRNA synthetase